MIGAYGDRVDGITYDVTEALDEANLGSTASAKIENMGLYYQREENADWIYCSGVGMVQPEETEGAEQAIREFFDGHAVAYGRASAAISPVAPTPRGRTCHVDADCYPGEVCVQSGGERQCVRREGPR